jgi:hypothetical protein
MATTVAPGAARPRDADTLPLKLGIHGKDRPEAHLRQAIRIHWLADDRTRLGKDLSRPGIEMIPVQMCDQHGIQPTQQAVECRIVERQLYQGNPPHVGGILDRIHGLGVAEHGIHQHAQVVDPQHTRRVTQQSNLHRGLLRSRYEITWPFWKISLRLLMPSQNFSGQPIL